MLGDYSEVTLYLSRIVDTSAGFQSPVNKLLNINFGNPLDVVALHLFRINS